MTVNGNAGIGIEIDYKGEFNGGAFFVRWANLGPSINEELWGSTFSFL